jgi:acetoin utilization deacetylase AcuC-like enzyme
VLDIPVVWSEDCLLHDPRHEYWLGVPIRADEVPARAVAIRDALVAAGARIVPAEPHDDATLLAVHDPGLVDFLRTASGRWREAGYPDDPGQDAVVPYIFPHPAFADPIRAAVPTSTAARTGFYAFDTMTPVLPQTWEAARAAVDVALTAADLLLDGALTAYACTRPPGHHVTASAYGGSCYLNNAAIAAEYLRHRASAAIAILDLDAHHGNGAQSIFWERADVFTGSVHVDPRAGWFPHFLGFEDETGAAAGTGANLNLPLAPGSGDAEWLASVETLVSAVDPDILVVALGVDAAEADPNSPLRVTPEAFRRAGEMIGERGRRTVVIQEGGYELASLGPLVRAFLEGLAGLALAG